MNNARRFAALVALRLVCPLCASQAAEVPHDRSFLMALKADDFKLPAGASAAALSREVLALLGSTDPELRDGVGYEAFASWVYRDELLQPVELESLRVTLMASARAGLGDAEGDGVFRRSFALLDLSVLAAEDLRRPFLTETGFQELLSLDRIAFRPLTSTFPPASNPGLVASKWSRMELPRGRKSST